MTIQEKAIEQLERISRHLATIGEKEDYTDVAIQALERETILDKIRVEIEDLDDTDYDYEGYYKAVTDALQIIDKYKTESEEK